MRNFIFSHVVTALPATGGRLQRETRSFYHKRQRQRIMYKKRVSGWRKHLDFIIIDIFCMHIALLLSYAIRHGRWDLYADKSYLEIVMVMTILDFLIAILFTSFKNVLRRGYFNEFVASIKHVCLVEVATVFMMFTMRQSVAYSRTVFYIFPVVFLFLTVTCRYGWKWVLRHRKGQTVEHPLLLVTTEKMAEEAIRELQRNRYQDFALKGVVIIDAPCEAEEIAGVPVVAGYGDVTEYCLREWVESVLIVLPQTVSQPEKLIADFQKMGIVVHRVIAHKQGDEECRQQVERIGNYTVLTTSMNYASREELIIKRVMDIAGGIVGCILTGFICLIFGPVIYLQSPGPIFFTQTRVGENGKRFKIYKLRTMYMDAEERKKELLKENKIKDGLMFKLDYDPRIIGNKKLPDGTIKKGIGSFLRESSLDEFPQFINVLKGDMSLVGTRPPTVDEWVQYDLHHRARLAIKPGLTGMWQVSGRSNITEFEEVVKLDTKYISEWSLGLDLRIIVKTVLIVLNKKGAV